MNLSKTIGDFFQYVSEAAARIFGPNDDKYPETGVQPFDGDPNRGEEWS
ncbi:isochorismate synthase [Oscillatoria sp. HE19RPO]|jgi:hypothetical protein|nr:isochorismate synthase [Oscillatoria sp. HE19RPO]